ncbi:MAG: hypothetical protein OXC68_11820 [Aestuariivita sp.]|nr:hypothetical protein [Aestuariivita sp.]
MDNEQKNAIAIAELKGDITAIRAEMDAMESRINASLAKNESAMDRLRADMERRDKENQRWIVGLFIATIVILGILIRWPMPPG